MTFLLNPSLEALASWLSVSSLAMCGMAYAQTPAWPERPIRIVTPYAAGSGPDISLRKITPELSKALGQAVIVENRPGAGGRIAAAEVARAAPDGYTFVGADTSTIILLPAMGVKLAYDAQKDLIPVVRLTNGYPLIAVPASSSIQKLSDLKDLGRPPTFGVSSLGSFAHVVCASLSKIVGVACNPIPYSQGSNAAMFDVVKGNIDMAPTYVSEVKGFLATGKVRLLVTFAPTRNPNYPDVPSISEFAPPDASLSIWAGFFAPAGTPAAVVDRLRLETNKVISGDTYKPWIESLGSTVEVLDGPGFSQFLTTQRAVFKKIVDTHQLTAE